MRYKRNPNIQIVKEPWGALLIDLASNSFHTLNTVATRIYHMCDGERTVEEIRDLIHSEFRGDKHVIEKDVLEFIRKLEKLHLVIRLE